MFFGGTFLMHASLGVLPQSFGFIDGFTHVGARFFVLIAAFSLAAGVNGARRAWFANLFGLADILIVASSLALVLLPQTGPHHPMMYAVFLPAPLWLWFHGVSDDARREVEPLADSKPNGSLVVTWLALTVGRGQTPHLPWARRRRR